jgi:anti-sigma B factor antagonist
MRTVPGPREEGADERVPWVFDGPTHTAVMPPFETRTERIGDSTYVVSVAGEIDLCTGPAFSEALRGALDDGATSLIVDLGECGFMDSTGITILMSAGERLNHSLKSVAVVTNHRNLLDVLRLTGVNAIVGLYPTRSAAVNDGRGD